MVSGTPHLSEDGEALPKRPNFGMPDLIARLRFQPSLLWAWLFILMPFCFENSFWTAAIDRAENPAWLSSSPNALNEFGEALQSFLKIPNSAPYPMLRPGHCHT
jgi:hypothetical protein